MANNFSVTASNLDSVSAQLDELNAQLKNTISELEANENSLSGMWEGEARNTFHRIFEEDKSQMTAFTDLILRYAETLKAISANYAQAEQTNIDTASTRTA